MFRVLFIINDQRFPLFITSPSMTSPIPVFILSGFLGAGKTTLLNFILHHQTTHKIAVIENEFGNTTIDTAVLTQNTPLHITTLKNGCICCNSRAELLETLAELLDQLKNQQINFTQLIIECTGMADPTPIIQTFLTHERLSEQFDLKGTITMVDVIHAPYHFKHFNVTQAQIAIADIIFLSKIDLLKESIEPFIQQLHHMNGSAAIYSTQHGQFNLQILNELNAFNNQTFPNKRLFNCNALIEEAASYDTKVNSFVIRREKPFDSDKLSQLIEKILNVFAKQLIRYKGIFNIQNASHRLIFQGVQTIYNSEWGEQWKNTETPYSEVVFIGIQLPEEEFRYFFNQL